MSVDLALERIARLIEGAATVDPMRWIDPDAGAVVSLAEYPEGPEAAFELAPGTAEDAGQGGCIPARFRLTVRLRIRYRLAGSRQANLARMQHDWVAIRNATMFAPGAWDYANTGLTLVLLGPLAPEGVLLSPGQTTARHVAAGADFTLELDQ